MIPNERLVRAVRWLHSETHNQPDTHVCVVLERYIAELEASREKLLLACEREIQRADRMDLNVRAAWLPATTVRRMLLTAPLLRDPDYDDEEMTA